MKAYPRNARRIITDGLFTGYLSNRETPISIGLKHSGGTMRTESWKSLADHSHDEYQHSAGTWRYEDLIADTDDAILMGRPLLSIDDKRYHFQFPRKLPGNQGGKKRDAEHPSYSGITTEFWNSCDASARASIGPSGHAQLGKVSLCRPWHRARGLAARFRMSNWAPHSQSLSALVLVYVAPPSAALIASRVSA